MINGPQNTQNPMDLCELVAQNSEVLQAKFQDLTDQFEQCNLLPLLEAFVEQIKSYGRISINMRQYTLISLLLFKRHQNMYEWVEEREKESPKNREQILKDKLGSYYEARMAFDHFFDDGERFRYGALNIGGLGATKYGEYCVILTKKFLNDCLCLTFLKNDSLKAYILPDFSVDIDRLKEDVADREHLHILAALKHQAELKTTPSEEWGAMVCCSDAYIEAITPQDIPVLVVDCVRMSKGNHDEYFKYLYEDFSTRLDDFKRYQVEYFRIMRKLLKEHDIRLELVDED